MEVVVQVADNCMDDRPHPDTVDSKLSRVQSFPEGTIPTLARRYVTRPLHQTG